MTNIIKYELKNHSIDEFVPFTADKPMLASYPSVNSQMFYAADPSVNPSSLSPSTNSPDPGTVASANIYNTNIVTNSAGNAIINPVGQTLNPSTTGFYPPSRFPDYVGAATILVPHIVDENFATFSLILSSVSLTSAAALNGSAIQNLFLSTDTAPKLGTIFTGMRVLRIPAHRFDTLLTTPVAIAANNNNPYQQNLGTYYIKISSNYIQTTITSVVPKVQNPDFTNTILSSEVLSERTFLDLTSYLSALQGVIKAPSTTTVAFPTYAAYPGITSTILQNFLNQRTQYIFDNTPFAGTNWAFESAPNQQGRLYGSIVEVWDSTGTTLKTTKVMAENAINISTIGSNGVCALEYDAFGYEAPSQTPTTGDIIRIYPRETYFNPIFFEIDYIGVGHDLTDLIAFMTNDVVQNLGTAVYSVYDNNGVTVDSSGNINGNVQQEYQIFNVGQYQIRKKLIV